MQHSGVGGFERNIRAAAHGDSDIRRSQRRRVVDPVPDLADDETVTLQFADDPALVFRQQVGADLDAELLSDCTCRARIVAGQHDCFDAHFGQSEEPSLGIGARLVAHGDRTGEHAADDQHGNRFALVIERCDPAAVRHRHRHPLGGSLGRAEEDVLSLDLCCQTFSAERLAITRLRNDNFVFFSFREDGFCKWMAGAGFQRGSNPQHLISAVAESNDIGDLRPSLGQRAGLVEGDGGELSECLEHRTALDQQATTGTG